MKRWEIINVALSVPRHLLLLLLLTALTQLCDMLHEDILPDNIMLCSAVQRSALHDNT